MKFPWFMAMGLAACAGTSPDAAAPQQAGVSQEVKYTPVKETETVDQEVIREYVEHRIAELRRCYERALDESPELSGTLTVDFTIQLTGEVSNARATGMANADVEACVVGEIQTISFPKPEGKEAVAVRYPLIFEPDGA